VSAGGRIAVDMLGLEAPVAYRRDSGILLLTPPEISPADVPCEHAFVFRLTGVLSGG
jgi:hypothetical protein